MPKDPQDPTQSTSEQTTRAAHGASEQQKRIGPYRVLELVGTGGMGEVYRAEQTEPLRRTVALKIIKRGMDTQQVIARFEAERQALALMDHPSIAKMFEAGSTPEGRPYFAMEYVPGIPIARYCDEHKLPMHERLKLFIELCNGVQHAHQKAIIHRDLKPSNVLVTTLDDKPIPKIIDFGVAKATSQKLTEKTMYTALGELIGTPEYMSPEQAALTAEDIDTRTDVYALGVILYELLSGALPFEPAALRKAGFEGIVRMIREDDPPRPSAKVSGLGERTTLVTAARRTAPEKLTRQLRGDLDWITMKALEKERTRRYASAAELAEDVRRHLRDEPVLAGPPDVRYRVRKFVRRHRVGVVAGSVVTVTLFAAVVVSVIFALSEAHQRRVAAAERDRANAEAQAAREVTEFLVNSFEADIPDEPRDQEVTARDILERGAERIDRELQDQPLLRARMMHTIGRVYANLGNYERAESMLRSALALRTEVLGERDVDVARSMSVLAGVLGGRQQLEEGLGLAEQAVKIHLDLLGPDHIDTARSLMRLASLEVTASDYTSARQHLETARAVFASQEGPNTLGVAWCWHNLGTVHFHTGDDARALDCYKRALAIKEKLLPSQHVDLAITLHWMGVMSKRMSNYDEAFAYFKRAVAIYEVTVGSEHKYSAHTMHMLGSVHRDRGNPAEARIWYQRSLAVFRETSSEESYDVANVLDDLGVLEHGEGRYAEAESLYSVAVPMMTKAFPAGKGNANLVGLLEHFAATMQKLNRVAEAESLASRAAKIREILETEQN